MTTDHQVTEDDEAPPPGRALGMVFTAMIVIATLGTVAWLVK